MEQLTTFINDKKKNDKLIMKRFDKFIEPKKDFIDDVWGVIKDYMIEPKYKKSYKFIQQKEIRYNPCCCDATTFFIGRRYKNLLQVKLTRTPENKIIENPQFKFYKIETMELKNLETGEQILCEYVNIKCCYDIDYDDGSVIVVYYMITADKYKYPLWNADEDDKIYETRMREIIEQEEADYQDYIDDIETMME